MCAHKSGQESNLQQKDEGLAVSLGTIYAFPQHCETKINYRENAAQKGAGFNLKKKPHSNRDHLINLKTFFFAGLTDGCFSVTAACFSSWADRSEGLASPPPAFFRFYGLLVFFLSLQV